MYFPDYTPDCESNRLLRAHFLISVLHTVWICYHNGADQCRQPLALPAVASMKKNFRSWVPTDRPWALYPLKANSHSACLNILLNPCPPTLLVGLNAPSFFAFRSFSLPLLISLSPSLMAVNVNGRRGRTAAWDAGAGWVEGETGGEAAIVGLDSTLSPLEHPLMGDLLTIEHLNLIMQIPTSKSNTL